MNSRLKPELVLDAGTKSADTLAEEVLAYLKSRKYSAASPDYSQIGTSPKPSDATAEHLTTPRFGLLSFVWPVQTAYRDWKRG